MSEGIVNSFCRVTKERRSLEWLRENTSRNEAQALWNARREEREHWQGVVAGIIAQKDAAIAEMDATFAQMDETFANQAAIIAELRAKLGEIAGRASRAPASRSPSSP